MKILEITTYISATTGGEFNICYNLSKALIKQGHTVTILATDVKYDENVQSNIPSVSIISFRCVANISGFLYTPSMSSWLSEHVHEYDIVHIHGYRGYQTNTAAKYARKYSIPYVIQPHGSFPRIIEKQRLKKLYDIVWGNNVLKNAKKVIAVSDSELISLVDGGINSDKISVIYNGVDVNNYFSQFYISAVNNPQIHPIVLYVGRLHQRKGVDVLLRAFSEFMKIKSDAVLRIAGVGENNYTSYLHKLCDELEISECVEFLGLVDDLREEYSNADVLVYPSVYEIFGLVPFEAILCGTPVIVTDDCGCGEIIGEIGCGDLVKYGDVNGLCEMIMNVLGNYGESMNKVRLGQEYIVNNLSWDKVVNQYILMYNIKNEG